MQIPVCMYHGSPEDRAELRRTVLASPGKHESLPVKKPAPKKKRRLSRRDREPGSDEESVVIVEDELNAPDDDDPNPTTQLSQFPVVVTTYEMIIKDRVHLARYDWGQVIVDEGHRLKNMDSILMREIKKYPSAGRTLLTGTPLHVSAINVPSIYASLIAFIEQPGRALVSPQFHLARSLRRRFLLPRIVSPSTMFFLSH
jgi:ATP-dependent DNA helicase